jgi:hypothetical protein
MKFKLCCFLLILAGPLMGSCLEASEGTKAWRAFSEIDRDIRAIRPEKVRRPLLREKLVRTVAAYEKLRSVVKSKEDWLGASFAPGYASQLSRDRQVLDDFNETSSSSWNKDVDRLDAALDDLYFKVEACLANGGQAVGLVSVTVHTKKSGHEVPNMRVMYIPKILRLYPHYSWTEFPQLSSPTKWELAPGNYLMLAENPETGEKSSVQETPIDRDQECDLAMP